MGEIKKKYLFMKTLMLRLLPALALVVLLTFEPASAKSNKHCGASDIDHMVAEAVDCPGGWSVVSCTDPDMWKCCAAEVNG
jgi:hypothetical protein